MKLIVRDVSYDLFDAIGAASLDDLIALKRHNGATVRSMKGVFERLSKISDSDDFDQLDFLSDPDVLRDFVGLIYVVRRNAGEDVSPAEAGSTPWSEFMFDFSDDPEEPDAPKADAGAEPMTT